MLLAVSILVAVGCVAASLRRLGFAVAPTWLDAQALVEALRGDRGRARWADVCDAIAKDARADWERDLVAALRSKADPETRTALVNEQLSDLDWRLARWARVPRVCASVASSAGLLLGALALRAGLNDLDLATPDSLHAALDAAAGRALAVVCVGVAGTTWCVAINWHAQRAAKARLEATDKLVERLEALASG